MFTTIAVHDPVPGDIEIQRYDHESEDGSVSKRTRVKLVSRVKGATTGGFAGIDIHGDTEALTNFVVVLLAKLVDMPTTIELDGVNGEFVLTQGKVVVPIDVAKVSSHIPVTPESRGDVVPVRRQAFPWVPWPADHRGEPRSPL